MSEVGEVMGVTSNKLKKLGFTFHLQGDEPYSCIEARDNAGNLIAWRNSNVWPKGDETDWEIAPDGKRVLS